MTRHRSVVGVKPRLECGCGRIWYGIRPVPEGCCRLVVDWPCCWLTVGFTGRHVSEGPDSRFRRFLGWGYCSWLCTGCGEGYLRGSWFCGSFHCFSRWRFGLEVAQIYMKGSIRNKNSSPRISSSISRSTVYNIISGIWDVLHLVYAPGCASSIHALILAIWTPVYKANWRDMTDKNTSS